MMIGSRLLSRMTRKKIDAIELIRNMGMSVNVVLIKDLHNKGREGEVVEVKKGHARNHLIPAGVARYATKKYLDEVGKLKIAKETSAVVEVPKTILNDILAADKLMIVLDRPCDGWGGLHQTIGPEVVVEELKKRHFDVPISSLTFPGRGGHIKRLGEFRILCRIGAQRARIDIRVVNRNEKMDQMFEGPPPSLFEKEDK